MRRMERKGEKGSEEDDYFNKFPPTMPSVVLENRSIRIFSLLSICTKVTTLVWYLIVNTLKVKLIKLFSVVLKEMTKM